MPNYIETSPALFQRLQALPAPAQRRLWQALQQANHRVATLLAQQEAQAARLRQQDAQVDQLLRVAAHLWDAHLPQLTTPDRRQHLAAARRQVAALAFQHFGWPAARIARRLRRDRATIHRALHQHVVQLHNSHQYAHRFQLLQQHLLHQQQEPQPQAA